MLKSLIILLLLAFCPGCNLLHFPAYVLFGAQMKKVKAAYPGLRNTRTAVIVATGPGTDFDFPNARNTVALATAYVLGQHVKGISFVNQEKINDFQLDDLDWLSLPMARIGAKFHADRVLYIDLMQYTMREENSVNLLRGHIIGDVQVYDVNADTPNKPVYQVQLEVFYPEDQPVPSMSDAANVAVQQRTVLRFADVLAKKFYDHKVAVEPGQK